MDQILTQDLHAKLEALPDSERYKDYYWTIEIGYAWIAGFRPYLYWANTTNCFDRMTNLTYIEFPAFKDRIGKTHYSAYDKIEMTAFLIQNISTHLWYCNSAWTTSNRYWEAVWEEYNGEVGTFFLSLL